jgi:excisionase family DNA binding protein
MSTRRQQIMRIRESSLSRREIGNTLGISGERVSQIMVTKSDRKARFPSAETPLSTGDVARLLNIHTNTVRRWCSKGILKSYRLGPRGDRRFVPGDVIKLLEES